MTNPACKKVISMLSAYIEQKLDEDDRLYVENHFLKCRECYRKYLEMKEIMNNLHFEYEKLLGEFERAEAGKIFNIREYETFYNNISPYIDDELCYDESIKFRRYLLKSKPARKELACAYGLKNGIKNSVGDYKNRLNLNYSKQIVNKLKSENKENFDYLYGRAALMLGAMLISLIVLSVFLFFNRFGASYAQEPVTETRISGLRNVGSGQSAKDVSIKKDAELNDEFAANFPSEDDMVEFYFDENHVPVLKYK